MDDYTLAEGEKVHERSCRRDVEGAEEETGMIIPSQEARKCMKEAAEEMARVQKRKQG